MISRPTAGSSVRRRRRYKGNVLETVTPSSTLRVTQSGVRIPAHLLQTNLPPRRVVELPAYFAATLELAGASFISSNNAQSLFHESASKLAGRTWGHDGGAGYSPPPVLASSRKA